MGGVKLAGQFFTLRRGGCGPAGHVLAGLRGGGGVHVRRRVGRELLAPGDRLGRRRGRRIDRLSRRRWRRRGRGGIGRGDGSAGGGVGLRGGGGSGGVDGGVHLGGRRLHLRDGGVRGNGSGGGVGWGWWGNGVPRRRAERAWGWRLVVWWGSTRFSSLLQQSRSWHAARGTRRCNYNGQLRLRSGSLPFHRMRWVLEAGGVWAPSGRAPLEDNGSKIGMGLESSNGPGPIL